MEYRQLLPVLNINDLKPLNFEPLIVQYGCLSQNLLSLWVFQIVSYRFEKMCAIRRDGITPIATHFIYSTPQNAQFWAILWNMCAYPKIL